jgi:hypothetical protein
MNCDCFICLESIDENEQLPLNVCPCLTYNNETKVHWKCLNTYLRINTKCPLCRTPMLLQVENHYFYELQINIKNFFRFLFVCYILFILGINFIPLLAKTGNFTIEVCSLNTLKLELECVRFMNSRRLLVFR